MAFSRAVLIALLGMGLALLVLAQPAQPAHHKGKGGRTTSVKRLAKTTAAKHGNAQHTLKEVTEASVAEATTGIVAGGGQELASIASEAAVDGAPPAPTVAVAVEAIADASVSVAPPDGALPTPA